MMAEPIGLKNLVLKIYVFLQMGQLVFVIYGEMRSFLGGVGETVLDECLRTGILCSNSKFKKIFDRITG